MKLSIVLATYNEENNLGDCLKSVKDIADEIIVVDGTSKDKTRKVAKEYGAKVYKVPNDPMFHKNKQLAVEKAKGKWILQLDADERATSELKSEIMEKIGNDNEVCGYYIPRKNWFLGRYLTKGGVYPDYVIRLFRNGTGYFPAKSVHEQIVIKGAVGYLSNDLVHLADPNIDKYLLRFNRYSDLSASDLVKASFSPNIVNTLDYLLVKPIYWFLMRFVRHKGFVDGFQGFLFALFSSLHYPVIYIKACSLLRTSKK
jgi:glycosyltransferase involved in cell wall biosynthesis